MPQFCDKTSKHNLQVFRYLLSKHFVVDMKVTQCYGRRAWLCGHKLMMHRKQRLAFLCGKGNPSSTTQLTHKGFVQCSPVKGNLHFNQQVKNKCRAWQPRVLLISQDEYLSSTIKKTKAAGGLCIYTALKNNWFTSNRISSQLLFCKKLQSSQPLPLPCEKQLISSR